jgi:hypothetical protein
LKHPFFLEMKYFRKTRKSNVFSIALEHYLLLISSLYETWKCMVTGPTKKGLNSLIILGASTLWQMQNDSVFNGTVPRIAAALCMVGEEAVAWGMANAKGLALLTGHDMATRQ